MTKTYTASKTKKKTRLFTLAAVAGVAVIGGVIVGVLPANQPSEPQTPETTEEDRYADVIGQPLSSLFTKEELLTEINRRRAEVGSAPLRHSPELEQSAQEKCDDMIARGYYDHVDPDGIHGYDLAENALGLDGIYGENLIDQLGIYQGMFNAYGVFEGWFFSAPHREAALDSSQQLTGFGICGIAEWMPNKGFIVQHFYSPEI